MDYRAATEQMSEYRQEIAKLRAKIRAVQQSVEPEPVKDYELTTPTGPVRLSQLFGGKTDLIVIHNMGASCRYCTLWADGFNGLLPHLEDRLAFVISSPDDASSQQKFKASRGWNTRMVSHQGTSFAKDLGYASAQGWLPGISVFQNHNGTVVRISDLRLGPGDDFCSLWHFFDLMPAGSGDWEPKFHYRAT